METKDGFWEFIKNNFFSITTIVVGVAVLGLNRTGLLSPEAIPPTILTLVIFLATSQLVDNSRKLDTIQNLIKRGFGQTISSLKGIEVIYLSEPEKGFRYLAKRVRESKHRLDLASFSPPISRNSDAASDWDKAIEEALLKENIRFRYVCNFRDEARLTRVKKHLANPKVVKFYVGYYPADQNIVPMPNFLVIDEEEIIGIFPYSYGEPEVWLSIKHPDVVKVFLNYFRRLWEDSEKIDAAHPHWASLISN
jgi:hypothetical protein